MKSKERAELLAVEQTATNMLRSACFFAEIGSWKKFLKHDAGEGRLQVCMFFLNLSVFFVHKPWEHVTMCMTTDKFELQAV